MFSLTVFSSIIVCCGFYHQTEGNSAFETQNSLKTKGKKTNGPAFLPSFYLYSAEGSKHEPSKDKEREKRDTWGESYTLINTHPPTPASGIV